MELNEVSKFIDEEISSFGFPWRGEKIFPQFFHSLYFFGSVEWDTLGEILDAFFSFVGCDKYLMNFTIHLALTTHSHAI